MILTQSRETSRFLRFAMVGVLGAVVDFGVFNLLTSGFHLPAVISSVISFLMAVISNFLWNRYWTYPDSRSKPVPRQMAQFTLVSLMGLAIRTPLFAWMEPQLIGVITRLALRLPLSPTFWGHNLGLMIAILVVMMWNFFANRYWTYADIQ